MPASTIRVMVALITFFVGTAIVGTTPAHLTNDDRVTDAASYAIYATLLEPLWSQRSTDPMVLQQETEPAAECELRTTHWDDEWKAIERAYRQANTGVRLLQPLLSTAIPYRLIAKGEIVADDARLARKYPGLWQRRPESMEFAAVSAVGFNKAKTKALVSFRLRDRGDLRRVELQGGVWVAVGDGCGWIA
jgi:hypothetical protein